MLYWNCAEIGCCESLLVDIFSIKFLVRGPRYFDF
jgi:hypothetical protein